VSDVAFGRFSEFYSSQSRNLWRYLVRIGADGTLAEDLSQEAFIRWSVSQAASWEEERARAYLFTIGTRLLTDWWRSQRRHAAWEATYDPPPATMIVDSPLFRSQAWAKLTKRCQQLLWLAYVEEFSHVEIAEICGVAPASVRVLLSRGRALLAQHLTIENEEAHRG
jgi:RNA polymerase sigma-70 factor (ECF subfamily)